MLLLVIRCWFSVRIYSEIFKEHMKYIKVNHQTVLLLMSSFIEIKYDSAQM